jgi:hypothetical protein
MDAHAARAVAYVIDNQPQRNRRRVVTQGANSWQNGLAGRQPMSERELGLSIGDRVGDDFEIIAAIPHATRDRTWIAAGRRGDGTYATWTASRSALDALPVLSDGTCNFTEVVDALADMVRRARS